jgi:hypothetical protein
MHTASNLEICYLNRVYELDKGVTVIGLLNGSRKKDKNKPPTVAKAGCLFRK